MPASAARPRATASKFSRSTKKLSAVANDCHALSCVYTSLMLDIRLIREKPDFVRERLATRGGDDAAKIDEVLRIDAERRKAETELQRLQSERNRLSKEIGARRSRKEPSEELEAEVRDMSEQIA